MLVALEAQRRKIEVTQAEIDALLRQDPFFHTNGTFDPAKYQAYKTDPASYYLAVLPLVREMAAVAKLESLRRRFTPTAAEVRAEWSRRGEQVRVKMLPLLLRDMPLEAESGESEWEAYYRAHPEQFQRKTRVRLRYARLPLPAEGDSARAAAEPPAIARARAIGDSLRSDNQTLP